MRRTYAPGEPAVEQIAVSGLPVPVVLKRHPRARRMTLRVSHSRGGVVLTLPRDCHHAEANRFVANNVDWIKQHLEKLPSSVAFRNDAVVPFRGENHRLEFVGPERGAPLGHADAGAPHGRSGGVVWVAPSQRDLFAPEARGQEMPATQPDADHVAAGVSTNPTLCVAGQVEHAPRRLQDWFVRQAKVDLAKRVAWHAERLELTPKRITVRDQTTRWGSCSSTGTLSFSWRLILAPPAVLDYVAAHEVAHLREMNHSQRFWDLVAKTMPEMEQPKSWLREHGTNLHSYGV